MRALSLPLLMLGCASLGFAAQAEHHDSKPIPSWYVGLAASVNFVRDADLQTEGGSATVDGTLETDAGYGIAGTLGYRPRYTQTMWDNVRFEAELGVRDNELDQFVSGASVIALQDDFQVQTAMLNLFVDFDLAQGWRPYIGAGVGAARFHVDSTDLGVDDDEDTTFAYQGMVGIYYTPASFPVAEFGVGYRYLGAQDPSFNAATTGGTLEFEYESHSLEVGSRFYF